MRQAIVQYRFPDFLKHLQSLVRAFPKRKVSYFGYKATGFCTAGIEARAGHTNFIWLSSRGKDISLSEMPGIIEEYRKNDQTIAFNECRNRNP
jgi:hypothetical protein